MPIACSIVSSIIRWRCAAFGRQFDVFHVTDHSYSHLVRYLPAARTIVTCHDVDSFRCVIEARREPRSLPFKLMTRHIVGGFRKAAAVACVSEATRREVLDHRLTAPERTTVIWNGVSRWFTPEANPEGDREAARLIGERGLRRSRFCMLAARSRASVSIYC